MVCWVSTINSCRKIIRAHTGSMFIVAWDPCRFLQRSPECIFLCDQHKGRVGKTLLTMLLCSLWCQTHKGLQIPIVFTRETLLHASLHHWGWPRRSWGMVIKENPLPAAYVRETVGIFFSFLSCVSTACRHSFRCLGRSTQKSSLWFLQGAKLTPSPVAI